eukprot:gene5781-2884_t
MGAAHAAWAGAWPPLRVDDWSNRALAAPRCRKSGASACRCRRARAAPPNGSVAAHAMWEGSWRGGWAEYDAGVAALFGGAVCCRCLNRLKGNGGASVE